MKGTVHTIQHSRSFLCIIHLIRTLATESEPTSY